MAYTQHFGLSRNSPLNKRQSIMQDVDTLTGQSSIDTDPSKASTIINQNNIQSKKTITPGIDVLGSAKKEIIKKGLKTGILGQGLKNAAKTATRLNPAALLVEALLSPMKAYGGPQNQRFEFDDFEEDIQKEKRLNRIQGMNKKQISESDAMYNLKNKPVYGKPPSQLKQGR